MSAEYAATLLRSVARPTGGRRSRCGTGRVSNTVGHVRDSGAILHAWLCRVAFRYGRRVRVRVKNVDSTLADYGYGEALGTQTSSLSSASFLSNCSNGGPRIAARPRTVGEARGKRNRCARRRVVDRQLSPECNRGMSCRVGICCSSSALICSRRKLRPRGEFASRSVDLATVRAEIEGQ